MMFFGDTSRGTQSIVTVWVGHFHQGSQLLIQNWSNSAFTTHIHGVSDFDLKYIYFIGNENLSSTTQFWEFIKI